jgi:hypothetical protein
MCIPGEPTTQALDPVGGRHIGCAALARSCQTGAAEGFGPTDLRLAVSLVLFGLQLRRPIRAQTSLS